MFRNFVYVSIGVKQGEPLSPILFIMFVNDMQSELSDIADPIRLIDDITLFMLMYADDTVLFSKSEIGLQILLNKLAVYCDKWDLVVNEKKTGVCVFESRKSQNVFRWSYKHTLLNIVDQFTYLGIKFNYTGNFKLACKALSEQALKSVHSLYNLFSSVSLNISTKLYIFDRMVVPILLYGSEVCAIGNICDLEKIEIQFYKTILNAKKRTPNDAILLELGRVPISVLFKERIFMYWLKIIRNKDSLIYKMYRILRRNMNTIAKYKNWALYVKVLLQELGFLYLWDSEDVSAVSLQSIKQRLRDQFMQNVFAKISTFSRLRHYCNFKTDYCYEAYLDSIFCSKYRIALFNLRCGVLNINVENGRHNNIPREQRLCTLCKLKKIEDEYHFLLVCPCYRDIRSRFLKTYYCAWPSYNKYINLLTLKSKKTILNLSKYIYVAMQRRKKLLS